MTHWIHPPQRDRDPRREHFDPVLEGARHGLPRDLALALWQHVCAEATDPSGRRDDDLARRRFHQLAARLAACGGRLRPAPGRLTRVATELDGAPTPTDALALRVPGRVTLVGVELDGAPAPADALALRVPGRTTLISAAARRRVQLGADAIHDADTEHPASHGDLPGADDVRRALVALQSASNIDNAEVLATADPGSTTAAQRDLRDAQLPLVARGSEGGVARLFGHGSLGARLTDASVADLFGRGSTSTPTIDEISGRRRTSPPSNPAAAHVRSTASPSARLAARGRDGQSLEASRDLLERVLAILGAADHGAPLPGELAARMTAALAGAGPAIAFDHVRVHTDDAAAKAAELIGAQAFTVGHHIYFARDQFAPDTELGDRLLRHELTHVAQHARGELAAHGALDLVADSSAAEAEARAAEARPSWPSHADVPVTGAEHRRASNPTGDGDLGAAAPPPPAVLLASPSSAPIARAPTLNSSNTGSDSSSEPGSVTEPSGVPSEALQLARLGSRCALPYRRDLELRYGTSLENIEVYTGEAAAQACAMVNAQAFAVGNIVVFASDNPSLEVVAHEVTHVLQQGGEKIRLGSTPANLAIGRDSDREELDAHDAGRAAAADPQPVAGRTPAIPATPSRVGDPIASPVLSRFPAPPDCHTFRPGLSFVAPIIKEGYDGNTYTAIKTGWDMGSWERRWQIYDADDKLLYESSYTWPAPTLKIPQDVIAKGKAGGTKKPWSVWIKVTKTLIPFGAENNSNFPHSYMKFNVYNTWSEYLADPAAKPLSSDAAKPPSASDDPSKKPIIDSVGAKGASSVTDYGSVVAMHEAYLRKIYDASAKGLSDTAQELVKQGVPQKDVAQWANEARNSLKATIRDQGNPILKRVFEERNLAKYGDKLGPSYEQLYAKYAKQGLTPKEIDSRIIQGSGKANIGFNRWAGRLKFAGRLALVLDICLAGVRVYMAPEGKKVETGLKELARIGGALALGTVGAEGGAALGAAIGALFAGIGAAPGAIIGGIIGGVGGAILGGWTASKIIEKLYEMFPPADCKFEGDFEEGIKPR